MEAGFSASILFFEPSTIARLFPRGTKFEAESNYLEKIF